MSRFLLCASVCLVSLAGCDTTTTSDTPRPAGVGSITVAIGSDIREIPYGEVTCSTESGTSFAQLYYPSEIRGPQGRPTLPRVLMARWRDGDVLEAHAFVPRTQYAGVDYEMLHILATTAEGARRMDCRVERGDEVTIACNGADIVPWLAPGERPQPSFKATFRCP